MSDYKQVIVMRKDLNMRKGKMIAQGAHATLNSLLNQSSRPGTISLNEDDIKWLKSGAAKICVYVESEHELEEVYQKARRMNISGALITDAGRTEFGGVPTKTCCAIGPGLSIEIDKITGHLPLL